MPNMWLWLVLGVRVSSKLTLTLLITMIIQHYRHIITHYKCVHNAL